MNARIIELLQQPSLIQNDDLQLLEKQIGHTPYVQNIRALYLYGIHLYVPERYKEVLTTTAAYTTDKKILYQFINQKSYQAHDKNLDKPVDEVSVIPKVEVSHEGRSKENIMQDDPLVDPPKKEEATAEANQLQSTEILNLTKVIDEEPKAEPDVKIEEQKANEILIKEDSAEEQNIIQTIKNEEEANGGVSFESIDDFLPNVKFDVPKNHSQFLNPPKFKVKEHQNVEIAFSSSIKKVNDKAEDIFEMDDHVKNLDFGPFSANHKDSTNNDALEKETIITQQLPQQERPEQIVATQNDTWKPMSISTQQIDAMIGKVEGLATENPEEVVLETETPVKPVNESLIDEESAENSSQDVLKDKEPEEEKRPIINVSFFGDSVAVVTESSTLIDDYVEEDTTVEAHDKSNVSQFINTWQSWLKIDRSEEIEKNKEVKKQKAIDEFIENQPKISQLKDEPTFVIKEKTEDISHLMTETLANIYLEQKLYSKAIKAFEILINKHPEKIAHYQTRIQEIKEQRKPF